MGKFAGPSLTAITGTFRRQIFEYNTGKIAYSGEADQDTAIATPTWLIKRYFYSGADLVDVQILIGAWTNRASLGWKSAAGD